jgi:hypothetical protein
LTDRVSVLGEFGGLGLPIEKHLWQNRDNWGYQTYKTRDELNSNYERLMLRLHPLIGQGLAAAVYTQTTDVEGEVNGLLTYDRAESKIEPELLARWHRRLYEPAPKLKVLLASSQNQPQKWRFTEKAPDAAWMKNDFADETWTEGVGGFGTKMTPNTTVRTEWKTSDIWLRRSFELAEVPQGEIYLDVYHDEDAEIYLNGVLAASPRGYVTSYGAIPISPEARKTLVKGQNRLAIHCKQTGGGQYIDAGLIELVPAKK